MIDLVDENIYQNDELKHWGIIGMKWGIRRYQNPDGTLTPEGRERYGVKTVDETKKLSYSKKYESLKNKKNRTADEEDQLQKLERGKKWFIDNHNKKVDLKTALTDNDYKKAHKEGMDWYFSTKFGKEALLLQTLGGVIGQGIYYSKNYSNFMDEIGLSKDKEKNNADVDKIIPPSKKREEWLKQYKKDEAEYIEKNIVPYCSIYQPDFGIVAVSSGNEEAFQKANKEFIKWQDNKERELYVISNFDTKKTELESKYKPDKFGGYADPDLKDEYYHDIYEFTNEVLDREIWNMQQSRKLGGK